MTGGTHRRGGMLISILGFAYLRNKGMLLPDVNEALQWLVMYPFCMWGSVASDLDHAWESVPCRDYPSRAIHMMLHIGAPIKKRLDNKLTDAKKRKSCIYKLSSLLTAVHRSWQTHSDLTLIALVYLLYKVTSGGFSQLGTVDVSILSLVVTGISMGMLAHLFLDSLTPEGIWCVGLIVLNWILKKIFPKKKIKLPRKLPHLPHKEYFCTGGKWEVKVRKFLSFATVVAVLWMVGVALMPYLPFEVKFM